MTSNKALQSIEPPQTSNRSLAHALVPESPINESEKGDSLQYIKDVIRLHNSFEEVVHVQFALRLRDQEFYALYYLIRKWAVKGEMSKVFEINHNYWAKGNNNTNLRNHLLRHEANGFVKRVYQNGHRYFRPTVKGLDVFADAFRKVIASNGA